jgi:hypothetical protein
MVAFASARKGSGVGKLLLPAHFLKLAKLLLMMQFCRSECRLFLELGKFFS